MMMAAAASNSTGMPSAAGKKPRKPYKITRPREKWAADEHDRFLHALLLFGRDWKSIEQFVTTKTATQIRSHAQKYFLKAQKLGIAAALPPPQLRRGAALSRCPQFSHPDGNAAAAPVYPLPSTSTSPPPPVKNSMDSTAPLLLSSAQQTADWACAMAGVHHQYWPSCGSEPSDASQVADAMLPEDDTIQLPLSQDDPRFAQVYRFVGDVFGSGAPLPVEAQLQRLPGEDPAVVATILLVLRNVEDNLFA